MSRWTVASGDHVVVIESTDDGLVSVDIPSGPPFTAGAEGIRDLRTKLGLALGDIQAERTT